jgi:hypothetical protein
LYDIVSQYDPCQLIPNGFDCEFFKRTVNIEERDKYSIAMMYHTQDFKGCDDGFEALYFVKKKYPFFPVKIENNAEFSALFYKSFYFVVSASTKRAAP